MSACDKEKKGRNIRWREDEGVYVGLLLLKHAFFILYFILFTRQLSGDIKFIFESP